MVSNRMTDGVGKKIVDALKKTTENEVSFEMPKPQMNTEHFEQPILEQETMPPLEFMPEEKLNTTSATKTSPIFNSSISDSAKIDFNTGFIIPEPQSKAASEIVINEFEDFELPANVEVLRQLITKLPSNVSKQTGAQIIKQTMEALGISMKGVLQEAQAVQENLNASARECQNNIAEYKRQINMLENQTQKLHRQYSMLNDIISLFIQASN